jgi:acetyl-CoA carboxylase carboxyltransferase component
MKKVSLLFAAVFFQLSKNVNAQSKTGADYFAGKWNVLVKGTPDGDHRMVFVLDKKDTALIGVVQDTTGKEIAKIDKIDIADKTAKVYFNASGYDVNVEINQKADDHVTGSLMGMFDAEGERIKAIK